MKPNFITNLLLGIALFVTLMFFMNQTAPKPEEKKASSTPASTTVTAAPAAPAANGTPAAAPAAGTAVADSPATPYDDIVVDCPAFTAVFTTQGAALKSYTLKNYYNLPESTKHFDRMPLPLEAPMLPGLNSLALQELNIGANRVELANRHWTLVSLPESASGVAGMKGSGKRLVFQTVAGDVVLQRVYDFAIAENGKTGFDHSLGMTNKTAAPIALSYRLIGPAGIVPDDTNNSLGILNGVSGNLVDEKKVNRVETYLSDAQKEGHFAHNDKKIVWLGLHNRFFTSLLVTKQPELSASALYERILPTADFAKQFGKDAPWIAEVMSKHPDQARAVLRTESFTIQPGATAEHGFQFYGGPLSDSVTVAFNPLLDHMVTYTYQWLGPISRPLLAILQYIASVTHNYGIAIILLTLMVKVVLHPLTRKSMRSQHKMQQVQPLLKQIREKYKEDKQKQQQETMRVFQENGVNPIGGCLPMLLQMPIFFALYGVFSRAFDIRQEAFIPGWINDLASPDALFSLGFTMPIFGWTTFNLLPLIYVLLQIWNMRMMPKSTDPQMESQMRMMRLMPVIFGFIFYAMPSGLVLYFAVQSILTIVEHYFLKRTLHAETAAAEAAKAGSAAGSATPVAAKVVASAPASGKKGKKK